MKKHEININSKLAETLNILFSSNTFDEFSNDEKIDLVPVKLFDMILNIIQIGLSKKFDLLPLNETLKEIFSKKELIKNKVEFYS
jgi:hypothetical protein